MAAVNVYNYAAEANPNNIKNTDPTALRGGGSSVALTGDVTNLVMTTTGTLSLDTQLFGTAALVLNTNGVNTATASIVGTSALVLATTGGLSTSALLIGTSQLAVTTLSELSASTLLVGTAQLVIDSASSLVTKTLMTGSAQLVIATAGALNLEAAGLTGQAFLVLSTDGTVTDGGVPPVDPYVNYYNSSRKQIGRHLHSSPRRGRYKHSL